MVMVDDISFPPHITTTKPLSLLGHGLTDIEIHFLQIKFTAIGVYIDPEIITHLQKWKGKSGAELAEDDEFFDSVIAAPVDKYLRIVIIKEIKGSQYGVQLESSVRDRLAADDKYEEEEEEALQEIVDFFQLNYFKKDSVLTFSFRRHQTSLRLDSQVKEKEEPKTIKVVNGNVVETIKKWYLGGTSAYSPSTISSLANTFALELSK